MTNETWGKKLVRFYQLFTYSATLERSLRPRNYIELHDMKRFIPLIPEEIIFYIY